MAIQGKRKVQDNERASELAEKLDVPVRLAEQICILISGVDAENTLKLLKKAKINIKNRQRRMLKASRNEILEALKEIVGNDVVKSIRNIITDAQIDMIVRYLLG